MNRKAAALAATLVFLSGFATPGGAESVLKRMTQGTPVRMDGEGAGEAVRLVSAETAETGESEDAVPVLRTLGLETPETAETEDAAPATAMPAPETAEKETPENRGARISGPGKMKAGTKKYFKIVYGEEKPKKPRVTWTLDCDGKIARVYRNGQVWVRPGATGGTVLTLKARIEGKDAAGRPWIAETATEIMVK